MDCTFKKDRKCPFVDQIESKARVDNAKLGGYKSRRTLSAEQARKMVEIRENNKRSK